MAPLAIPVPFPTPRQKATRSPTPQRIAPWWPYAPKPAARHTVDTPVATPQRVLPRSAALKRIGNRVCRTPKNPRRGFLAFIESGYHRQHLHAVRGERTPRSMRTGSES